LSPALEAFGLLGPGGALEAALPGYEHRPAQLAMARAVEALFAEHGILLAEAGTGTGKTLAYLVPAVLSGRKVVVSTATKTLQEQIFFKDIPLLRDQAHLEFDAAYLKGRANYLCAHRFEAFDKSPTFASREEGALWPALRDWAFRTQSGDRAEADLPDNFSAWRQLSTTSETCLGSRCPLFEPCFVTKARRRAESADVLVVNHHLFFADLALRSRPGADGAAVLPRYDAVVFDEAHALEDVATDFFGVQVSSFRVEDLATDALAALPPKDTRSGMVSAMALSLRARAEAFFKGAPRALGLSATENSTRLTRENSQRLAAQAAELNEALAGLSALTDDDDEPALGSLRRRADELAAELDFVLDASSDEHVYWAEGRGRGVFLRAAPIEVAADLQKRLYGAVDTVLFTSATLTAQGRFDFFAGRMGVPLGGEGVRALAFDSPFDFPTQAGLYLPTHLPEPNDPAFPQAVADEIVALTKVSGGRAFALFTSLRNMEAVHALAAPRLSVPALLQGERPKSALLEAFKARPSVLFAAHSFWEGVDVPGAALSLVIIDKLPFASPGDPLVAARIDALRARGQEPFSAYQVPEAAIALRQGFGRLIRTKSDRGVVALLDRRVSTKAYGRAFLQSLPKARRLPHLDALRAFFEAGDGV
jgi:ATP-dependent DNA helicase DinG